MVIAFTRYPPLVNSFRGSERDEGNNKILFYLQSHFSKVSFNKDPSIGFAR